MSKARRKKDDELVGIDAISAFAEKGHATLLNWRNFYQFPMWKDKEGLTWFSSKKKIIEWYTERDCNPRTVSEAKLEKFRMNQLRESGQAPRFNRTLYDPDNIANFFNIRVGQVIMFERDYLNCPIKKGEGGRWEVDADQFQQFLEGLNLKIGPQRSPGPSSRSLLDEQF